jgi:hypothetical protein
MSFDSSRFTFDSWNDFLGVVMQQGRVHLDSEWNEWLTEFARRIQAGTLDIVGPAAVPSTTPHAFSITTGQDSSGNTTAEIGPGRMYLDGFLAENHGRPRPNRQKWIPPSAISGSGGAGSLNWDSSLDELVGNESVDYNHQPYYPNAAPFPQSGGPYLVYLDVWQREVTFLEDPDLVEKAVGVDTTGRLQTVWQVKWLAVEAGATCFAPGTAWNNLLLPPGAQLTTGVVQSGAPGPCCLTPNTGYTGLENQLYRVEIHQGGTLATATFKWSRDNASVATGVTGIAQGGSVLTVPSTGKDNVLGFAANDWVEITDDWLELNGLPGELHQVTFVNAAAKTITVVPPVSSSSFSVDSDGQTLPYRHTRLTRWDGTGTTGGTPVSSSPITLENGITVSFGLLSGAQGFNSGDYWVFAARSVDGTVEYLDTAPPRGTHHHYAQLSVVNFSSAAIPASGTATLSDQSQPPVGFLTFQANNPAQWPSFFGVMIRANPLNPANFDLEVVHNLIPTEGASVPVVVESFPNLSLTTGPTYAPTVINGKSSFISVATVTNPPSATLVFPSDYSISGNLSLSLGTQAPVQLKDNNSVPFLTFTTTPVNQWPTSFSVSASPGATTGTLTLEVVYAPPGGKVFTTLESFDDLSQVSVEGVASEFITNIQWVPGASLPALQLVTRSDCRIPWPAVSGGCCECGCTVSAQPGDTLQDVLDKYQNLSSPTEICLGPGIYSLPNPLQFTAAHSNITLKACKEGTVILRAQSGAENQFRDGLVVLHNANHVTLQGLQFAVPWTILGPSVKQFQFAGWPVASLDPTVAGALSKLAISIGVRPIHCSSLTIENCRFTFADPSKLQQTLASLEASATPPVILFGAGIFAGGSCEGLQLTGNTFTGGAYFKDGFLAGFLLTPTVTFSLPGRISFNPIFSERAGASTDFTADVALATTRTMAKTAAVETSVLTKPAPGQAIASIEAASNQPVKVNTFPAGLFGSFTQIPPAYAAAGGSVVPAGLNEAVFEDNAFEGLTIAVLILADSETIRFAANNVSNGGSGLWLLSPLETSVLLQNSLLLDSASLDYFILAGASLAMGYPLPQGDTTVGVPVPPAPATVFIHAGKQGTTLVDSQRNTWTADANLAGGDSSKLATMTAPVTNALPSSAEANQAVYKAFRYGQSFTYTFPSMVPGYYTVTLKVADIDVETSREILDAAGAATGTSSAWTFDVCINSRLVSTVTVKLDVKESAAQDLVFTNIPAVNISEGTGQIVIQFAAANTTSMAMVSAVEINPQWSQSVSNPGSATGFENFYGQLAALSQQGYADLAPLQMRIADNEMHGLSSVAVLVLGEDQVQNGKVSSLMMTGNQLDSIIQLGPSFAVSAQTSLNLAVLPAASRADYFLVTAAIVSVRRCVVSANLITNEWTYGRQKCGATYSIPNRASFLLDDRPPLTAAEISVMSNTFQGMIWISPPPNSQATNGWYFFNSVTA